MTATRRSILLTLGKAIGAGGLLLPGAGKGALALPAGLGDAAKLPVITASLPFSKEALQLRHIRDALHDISSARDNARSQREWRPLMIEAHEWERAIWSRPNPTWADCVELAEICWHYMGKAQEKRLNGDWEYQVDVGALSTSDNYRHSSGYTRGTRGCPEAMVALVEAILTLGKGERRDPKTDRGYWPTASAPHFDRREHS